MRRSWTGPEIQMLEKRYPVEGPKKLALELGRSEDSVSSFAHRCGLRTWRWLTRQRMISSALEPVDATA